MYKHTLNNGLYEVINWYKNIVMDINQYYLTAFKLV